MFFGLSLIGAFVAGGVCMFAVSEHYFKRIGKILHLDESDHVRVDHRPGRPERR